MPLIAPDQGPSLSNAGLVAPQFQDPALFVPSPVSMLDQAKAQGQLSQLSDKLALEQAQRKADMALTQFKIAATQHLQENLPVMNDADVADLYAKIAASNKTIDQAALDRKTIAANLSQGLPDATARANIANLNAETATSGANAAKAANETTQAQLEGKYNIPQTAASTTALAAQQAHNTVVANTPISNFSSAQQGALPAYYGALTSYGINPLTVNAASPSQNMQGQEEAARQQAQALLSSPSVAATAKVANAPGASSPAADKPAAASSGSAPQQSSSQTEQPAAPVQRAQAQVNSSTWMAAPGDLLDFSNLTPAQSNLIAQKFTTPVQITDPETNQVTVYRIFPNGQVYDQSSPLGPDKQNLQRAITAATPKVASLAAAQMQADAVQRDINAFNKAYPNQGFLSSMENGFLSVLSGRAPEGVLDSVLSKGTSLYMSKSKELIRYSADVQALNGMVSKINPSGAGQTSTPSTVDIVNPTMLQEKLDSTKSMLARSLAAEGQIGQKTGLTNPQDPTAAPSTPPVPSPSPSQMKEGTQATIVVNGKSGPAKRTAGGWVKVGNW